MIETIRRFIFKKKKPRYHSQTFNYETPKTKKISLESSNILLIEQDSDFWLPFNIAVADNLAESLYKDLEKLREHCNTQGYTFYLSGMENGFDKVKRKHLYIDPNFKDNQVYDVDFYFNEAGEIDSFSVGTREKLFAFAGEPPKVISKTSLKDFEQAIQYLFNQFKKKELL